HAVAPAPPALGLLEDLHARATGKILLAHATPEDRAHYLETHELGARTPRTITDVGALERELARVREDGYATNREELTAGVSALAVPLDGGTSPFSVALSAPAERFEQHFDSYLATLRECAADASAQPLAQR